MNFEDETLEETDQDDEEDGEEDGEGDEAGESSLAASPPFSPTDDYDQIAYFYDLEYRYRNQDVRFYLEMARRAGSKSRILEVACGTGRVSQKLLEAGFNVTGLDISKEMLRLAEQR